MSLNLIQRLGQTTGMGMLAAALCFTGCGDGKTSKESIPVRTLSSGRVESAPQKNSNQITYSVIYDQLSIGGPITARSLETYEDSQKFRFYQEARSLGAELNVTFTNSPNGNTMEVWEKFPDNLKREHELRYRYDLKEPVVIDKTTVYPVINQPKERKPMLQIEVDEFLGKTRIYEINVHREIAKVHLAEKKP